MPRVLIALALISLLVACASPIPSPSAPLAPTSTLSPTFAPPRFVPPTSAMIVDCMVGANIYTWQDLDRDGLPDSDEPPLPGVLVDLPAASIGKRATDDRGEASYFALTICSPLTIIAVAETPAGYTSTTPLRVPVSAPGVAERVRFGFAKESP
jgi:hypothetical protein